MLTRHLFLSSSIDSRSKLLLRMYIFTNHRTSSNPRRCQRLLSQTNERNSSKALYDLPGRWFLPKRLKCNDAKKNESKVLSPPASNPKSSPSSSSSPSSISSASPLPSAKSLGSSSASPKVIPQNQNQSLEEKKEQPQNLVKVDDSSTKDKNISLTKNPTKEIKKFELKTNAGLLTITTTIEDSKINEVILEKTSPKSRLGKKKLVSDGTNVVSSKTSTASSILGQASSANLTNEKKIPSEDVSSNVSPAQKNLSDLTKETMSKQIKKLTMMASPSTDSSSSTDSPSSSEEIFPEKVESDGKKMSIVGDTVLKTEKLSASIANNISEAVQPTSPPPPPPPEVKPKLKRSRVDFNRSSMERNFITPNRALGDFLLKPSDLETLQKIKRRSPYEQEPPITVYWRKDVEAKAIEVWGSRENLLKEALKREVERKKHQQNLFTVKRRLREYRREIGYRTKHIDDDAMGLHGTSGRVVLIAIGINGLNFIFKVLAWLYSGSHSMFAEAIHSLADTTNQVILAYGIHKSVQMADPDHPYGYSNMRHVSSLISGVGIFCVGCGLSVYHGITGLMNPLPLTDLFWSFCVLGGSLVSEGATLMVALNKLRRSAKKEGVSLKDYILSGKDPCVNVVLTEDTAAVTSVAVAATCMGLTYITNNPIFDAMGSLLVGGILGGVASFIIYTNSSALVGKSISEDLLEKINSELETDCMIRAIYDVKGIHMGNSLVRYKAELDFDGRELSRYYLEKQDINELFKLVKSFQSADELEQFLIAHGENIVDLMGGEIDRIELKLRSKFPEIRHCDLEIL